MVASQLETSKLRLWSRIVTGHQLFGTRFSEGVDTVKDVAEKALTQDSESLLDSAEKSVKKDISSEFESGGWACNSGYVCMNKAEFRLQRLGTLMNKLLILKLDCIGLIG